MNINLHIERLILDGLVLTSRERAQLQAAVEAELALLLMTGGLKAELTSGAAVTFLRANASQLVPANEPQALGTQIAGAVHEQIGRS